MTEECIPSSSLSECFDKKKAIAGLVNVTSPVLWWKDFVSIFNIRKIIIIGLIVGSIFAWGYYKGLGKAKVLIPTAEWIMKIDGHYLHWDPKINELHTQVSSDPASKDKIKVISVKDIPTLYAKIKPYGFQTKPVICLGGGFSDNKFSGELGGGLSWFKWFNWRANATVTSKGVYPLGISYKITENTSIGVNGGIGYSGKDRKRISISCITEF